MSTLPIDWYVPRFVFWLLRVTLVPVPVHLLPPPTHPLPPQYYGTGECFLFKLENGERVAVKTGSDADSDGGSDTGSPGGSVKNLMEGAIATFGWTGMNMYLQYSDGAGLGMGGGGMAGSFGLFVGEDFLSGSTGK